MSEEKGCKGKGYILMGIVILSLALGVWVYPQFATDDDVAYQTSYITESCFAEIVGNSTGYYLMSILCESEVEKTEFTDAYVKASQAVKALNEGSIIEGERLHLSDLDFSNINFTEIGDDNG